MLMHPLAVCCPSCGASVKRPDEGEHPTCPYCRATIDLGRRDRPRPPDPLPPPRKPSGVPFALANAFLVLALAVTAVFVLLPSPPSAPSGTATPPIASPALAPKPVDEPPPSAPTPPPDSPPDMGLSEGAAGVMSSAVPSPDVAPVAPPEEGPPPRSAYQTLQGCFARTPLQGAASGDGLATVQLALRVAGAGTEITSVGTVRRFTMDYALDLPGAETWRLPVTSDTAPAAEVATTRFAIAMAAGDGVLVVASQNVVTGWSLAERRISWSVPLGGLLQPDGPAEASLSVDCQRLTVQRGVVTIPRQGMRALRVRASDGLVR